MTQFIDLALTYDVSQRRCDLTLGDDYDLVLDDTPLPAILLSVGLDRRASPDDDLPEGRTQFLAPISFSERRGGLIDGLTPSGDRAGCKMWLLDRAKETETTRQLAVYYLAEGLAWVLPETGRDPMIEVDWVRQGVLGYRVLVEDASVALSRKVDA